MIEVKVNNGKYTVLLPAGPQEHGRFRALRYGEEWRDLIGDNLVYGLAYELDKARRENARLREALEKLARLGNGDHYGNSIGNEIARAALGDKL